MKTNLQVTIFRNGDTIMHTKNIIEWQFANKNKIPAWCYYNNDEINSTKLGKLYNWFAIIDKRGIAPKGWHIPTKVDFNNLINELGGHKKDLLKLMKKEKINVAISAHGNSIRLFRKIMEKKSEKEAISWEIPYDKVFTYDIEV